MRAALWKYPCLGLILGFLLSPGFFSQGAETRLAAASLPQQPIPAQEVEGRSPIQVFRHLLSLTPEQRSDLLADKPENQRKALLQKISEYEALAAEDREQRLKATEMLHSLLRLLSLPREERLKRLESVPETQKQPLAERLQQWDLLPPAAQQQILNNELTLQYFLRLESRPPPLQPAAVAVAPDGTALEEQLNRWQAMPPTKRQTMYRRFQDFFELPAKEKEKTLEVFSEEEKEKMEQSLRVFEQLSPEQRAMCIDSFRKLANMEREDRHQFLKNAVRWQAMTARERETWRNLVSLLPPQTPPLPDLSGSPVSLPGAKPPAGLSNAPNEPRLPGDLRLP